MHFFRYLFISVMIFLSCHSHAQDYGWWNELVKWDGKTTWPEYLQLSTAGLGPNALPVPQFYSENIGDNPIFETGYQFHYHPGDPTSNMTLALEVPFFERIAIRAWIAPLEYYNMDIATRDARRIRQFDPKGMSIGDFYFGTFIHVLKENHRRPTLTFSANMKTASGGGFEAGRVTETPGYYFDLLLAKTYALNPKVRLRPYIAGGLYVYQTYSNLHFQNDAFSYGIGLNFHYQNTTLGIEWAGYNGYLDIGDRPSLLRTSLQFKLSDTFLFENNLQFGLRDFPYQTISLTIHYIWKK